ncbi:NAD-dependent epimerase/dehydratase family protein [soil metagenome]
MYLVTGTNGFLGRILVDTLGQPCQSLSRTNAQHNIDLATEVPSFAVAPEVVVHAAGKAHSVPKTSEEARAFFDVNLTGTQNLVKGLENALSLPKAFIFISTVAVYGRDMGTDISETQPLQGDSPYAQSKRQAEDFLQTWGRKTGVRVGILRLPLVVGPNPPGNLGTMIHGIKTSRYIRIGSGATRKSVVLAADIATVLPVLAERGGVYNLTDGQPPSFAELEEVICRQLGRPLPKALPLPIAKLLGKVGDVIGERSPVNSATIEKMTTDLTFDDSKARKTLGWQPRKAIDYLEVS